MSRYKCTSKKNPVTGELVIVHEHVYMCLLANGMWMKGICSTPKGYHVHHIDNNGRNNDPSNLVLLTYEDHMKLHEKERLDTKEKKRLAMLEYYKNTTPEQRKARTVKAKEKQMELSANTPATPAMLFAMSKARVALKAKRDAAKS